MWILFAAGSAVFAGLTAILTKIGVKNTDSTLATAIRTTVVLAFSWLLVLLIGSHTGLAALQPKTWLFLLLSGAATGLSWLCYCKALQLGDVNKVTPIDKSSTLLTMLIAFLWLGEPVTGWKLAGMAAIAVGTAAMLTPPSAVPHAPSAPAGNKRWLLYAVLSAVFASLTSILGKIGIQGVESNLGTAIRTLVVFVIAWLLVFAGGKQRQLGTIDRRSWLFLLLSGTTTGLSWLCYYRALQDGPASVVAPIDKLSILVTMAFAAVWLKERLFKKAAIGLALLTGGTLLLLVPA